MHNKRYLYSVLELHFNNLAKNSNLSNIKNILQYIYPKTIESRRKTNYKGYRAYNTDIIYSNTKEHNKYELILHLDNIKKYNHNLYFDCLNVFKATNDIDLNKKILSYCNKCIANGLLS